MLPGGKGLGGINPRKTESDDPIGIKDKSTGANFEFFYKICISIPIAISFSLVFFMIFYISPRGQSLHLFQKGIYEWNKDRLAEHMASLQFEYKIMPYASPVYSKTDALPLPHSETDLLSKGGDVDTKELGTEHKAEEEFEKSVRQIYYYQ